MSTLKNKKNKLEELFLKSYKEVVSYRAPFSDDIITQEVTIRVFANNTKVVRESFLEREIEIPEGFQEVEDE